MTNLNSSVVATRSLPKTLAFRLSARIPFGVNRAGLRSAAWQHTSWQIFSWCSFSFLFRLGCQSLPFAFVDPHMH